MTLAPSQQSDALTMPEQRPSSTRVPAQDVTKMHRGKAGGPRTENGMGGNRGKVGQLLKGRGVVEEERHGVEKEWLHEQHSAECAALDDAGTAAVGAYDVCSGHHMRRVFIAQHIQKIDGGQICGQSGAGCMHVPQARLGRVSSSSKQLPCCISGGIKPPQARSD